MECTTGGAQGGSQNRTELQPEARLGSVQQNPHREASPNLYKADPEAKTMFSIDGTGQKAHNH